MGGGGGLSLAGGIWWYTTSQDEELVMTLSDDEAATLTVGSPRPSNHRATSHHLTPLHERDALATSWSSVPLGTSTS